MQIANIANAKTMSSREIADFAKARHNDVVVTIERLFEKGLLRSSRISRIESTGGRPIEVYDLLERDVYLVTSGYSDEVRSAIIDRWQELEAKNATPTQAQLSETQDKVTALLMIGKAMALVEGVRPGIMAAQTLECIAYNTGLNTDLIRLALPAAVGPRCSLNATNLGKHIGLSGKATNLALYSKGLQQRNDRDEWELTESGKQYAEALPYVKRGHSGYQILWDVSVARIIQ